MMDLGLRPTRLVDGSVMAEPGPLPEEQLEVTSTSTTQGIQLAPSGAKPQLEQQLPTNEGASRVLKRSLLEDALRAIDAPLHIDRRPELAGLVNWSGASSEPIHRWFRYREGFSPRLITALSLGNRLLDPFCGSGSIMVGAAQLGCSAAGLDVNPLATFVARTKLTPLTQEQLGVAEDFARGYRARLENASLWPAPALGISGKVFEPVILETLLRLRTLIEDQAHNDPAVKGFLMLAWIAILQDVGSYFKEGNGIKYRRKKRTSDGYVVREEGRWQEERFGIDQDAFVLQAFSSQLAMMLEDTAHWARGHWRDQRVLDGSALDVSEQLQGEQFDSVVFSPPYANRFDYFESLKVEMWFGGFVNSYEELLHLRKQSLRSHLGADLTQASIQVDWLEELLDLMDRNASSWRMGVPAALRGYFHDMLKTLRGCRQLAPGGRCYIVVGNSAYAGVIVPTDALLALLGLEAGFTSARLLEVRHLTVAPQQRVELEGLEKYMRESVVVLQ
jgi:site-specific DNA-methyltransferase (adenine-specific)